MPNSISLSERFSNVALFLMISKTYLIYNFSPEIRRILTRQKKKRCSEIIMHPIHHAGDGIIPILHKKAFVTRHLLSNLY